MDYDSAYANSAFIAGAETYPPRWEREAAAFRSALGARAKLGLAYGPLERNRFDLFLPQGEAKGLLVFVHGGYWLETGRESWSHLAAGAVERGFAVSMPSYTQAPAARIRDITQEVARSIEAASTLVSGPVVVTGHSAGGHLSARMGCADMRLAADVVRVVPISPLSDLEPLAATSMNAELRLDAAEIAAESPARLALRSDCSAHVWVGAQERPSFLWQARLLSEAWNCPWTPATGKHHFDVFEDLTDARSDLVGVCLDAVAWQSGL
ncbi:alpha/beta hydrolase [Mesorhizobium sp. B1-1-8]|uniref:alpha/beta hydrolase n=1 Tax=Mesorhizobium sp. B1-1-8 TaxID=2589976 RepID=UPI00112E8CE0|nr:alpha/beta hydrolase [Mesorhizobium sp. B1-1-8]UCI06210.1 alpha/beta hydrolase [Mesorhizobium sp. B1-1-8]